MSPVIKNAFFLIFAIIAFSHKVAFAEISKEIYKKAADLLAAENDYINQRAKNNWEKIYSYQNPRYKRKISIEEFKYFNGRLDFYYREKSKAHISGARLLSVEEIKSKKTPKDILGFPIRPRYRWIINPLFTFRKYEVLQILISKDGKRAKANWLLEGREQIDPRWTRSFIDFPVRRPYVDFWESTEEGWRIAVSALFQNISGQKTIHHLVPFDKEKWDHSDFFVLRPEDIKRNNPVTKKGSDS